MTFELLEPLSPLESLRTYLHEARSMHACPYLNGKGTCITGCGSGPEPEPHCITDCPDSEGWGPEIHRLELLIARDLEKLGPSAGPCAMRRRMHGRMYRYVSYHRKAPQGLSFCCGCRRVVVRGEGRWWE